MPFDGDLTVWTKVEAPAIPEKPKTWAELTIVERRKAVADALRSGRFKQVRGHMKAPIREAEDGSLEYGFCFWGVAREVADDFVR